MSVLHCKVTESYVDIFWSAELNLSGLPEVGDEGLVKLPQDVRRSAEAGIEEVADAFAIRHRCRRTIRSPMHCVHLAADNPPEAAWLSQQEGIAEAPTAFPENGGELPLDVVETLLQDRSDGVALLAEALSHQHATGQFHEIFRLFERAFRTDCERLIRPLASFLNDDNMGYSKGEIETWVKVRGPATHADRRLTFLLEADTRPYIHRMFQAAYDVLCNKAKWRDRSPDRRNLWLPSAGTPSPASDIFMIRGEAAKMTFAVLDSFGTYPRDLKCDLPQIPADWWPRAKGKHSDDAHN